MAAVYAVYAVYAAPVALRILTAHVVHKGLLALNSTPTTWITSAAVQYSDCKRKAYTVIR